MPRKKTQKQAPWNKGKLVGQKLPLKLQEIYAIRVRLQLEERVRDLALFNLAIDSKLRGCDLVKIKLRDIAHGSRVANRGMVIQQKTSQPVKFEITKQTRDAVEAWITKKGIRLDDWLFPSRIKSLPHITTRQYARIVEGWIISIGLDNTLYGTHSLRRTKATLVYKRTKNIRAVQLLLGHNNLESTVRYLGVEVDDALEISEQTEA